MIWKTFTIVDNPTWWVEIDVQNFFGVGVSFSIEAKYFALAVGCFVLTISYMK